MQAHDRQNSPLAKRPRDFESPPPFADGERSPPNAEDAGETAPSVPVRSNTPPPPFSPPPAGRGASILREVQLGPFQFMSCAGRREITPTQPTLLDEISHPLLPGYSSQAMQYTQPISDERLKTLLPEYTCQALGELTRGERERRGQEFDRGAQTDGDCAESVPDKLAEESEGMHVDATSPSHKPPTQEGTEARPKEQTELRTREFSQGELCQHGPPPPIPGKPGGEALPKATRAEGTLGREAHDQTTRPAPIGEDAHAVAPHKNILSSPRRDAVFSTEPQEPRTPAEDQDVHQTQAKKSQGDDSADHWPSEEAERTCPQGIH